MIKIGAQELLLRYASTRNLPSRPNLTIMSSTQVNGANGDYEDEKQRLDEVTPNPQETCKKDEVYYFELVVFKVWRIPIESVYLCFEQFCPKQVEDTLFRVPKSIFNVKDSVIGDMFLLPNFPNNAGLTQGSTEDFPIVFEDKTLIQIGVEPIKKADFQALLRVMIPLWGHLLVFGV